MNIFKNFFFAIGTIGVLAIAWPYLPFHSPYTVTVTGTAQQDVANQVATFNASVTATNPNKQTAIDSVNTKMDALIKSIKDFGIADSDIKTQNVSVYQMPTSLPVPQGAQTLIYPVPPQQTGNGDWQASNSITITLRDVSKASGLTDILNKSGATNVYGPNLTTDNTSAQEADLLAKAMANAKSKADSIAKAGGQSVGRIVTMQESDGGYPVPLYATKGLGAGSSAPIQPGTSTLSKTVTVTFELR